MTAREIIRAAYGDSRNFMTPYVLRVGKLHPRIAYELSSDSRGDLWGVTLVRWEPEYQKAIRLYEHSRAFPSRAEAEAYIERLRDRAGELLTWQDPYSY